MVLGPQTACRGGKATESIPETRASKFEPRSPQLLILIIIMPIIIAATARRGLKNWSESLVGVIISIIISSSAVNPGRGPRAS